MNNLESLESYNLKRTQEYEHLKRLQKNGIACPKCGSEMFDSDPQVVLTSNPPKKNVACQCGYRGYRVA